MSLDTLVQPDEFAVADVLCARTYESQIRSMRPQFEMPGDLLRLLNDGRASLIKEVVRRRLWMRRTIEVCTAGFLISLGVSQVQAQTAQQVVDIPTRPGVTQRMLVLSPPTVKAAVILFAGGHGGLQIFPNGSFKWGAGNFLVRTRQLFADQGLMVAVVDAPSDRQKSALPRRLPSEARACGGHQGGRRVDARALQGAGLARGHEPRHAVRRIRRDRTFRPRRAGRHRPDLDHPHRRQRPARSGHAAGEDPHPRSRRSSRAGWLRVCAFANVPALMAKLANSPRKELLAFRGGESKGDPCEAMAYHGFNGVDRDVVQQVSGWILGK